MLHCWAVGTLRQITEHRRFDPAGLTLSTLRDLVAAPDDHLAPVMLDRLDGVAAMLASSYPRALGAVDEAGDSDMRVWVLASRSVMHA